VLSREGQLAFEFPGDGSVVPALASEVSGTALAAALLRDGWSVSHLMPIYCFFLSMLCRTKALIHSCSRNAVGPLIYVPKFTRYSLQLADRLGFRV
jgi:hypothetical protein